MHTRSFERATAVLATAIALVLGTGMAAAVAGAAATDGREQAMGPGGTALVGRSTAAPATSFGDGLHRVGSDIQPGRYRTTGTGALCYWAHLGPGGAHLSSRLGDAPQTLTVGSAYFETQDCGTWRKVG